MSSYCAIESWVDHVRRITPAIDLADLRPCTEWATHVATVQRRNHGLSIQVTALVCVMHAELTCQPRPGWISLPLAPLPVAQESR
jgi:hypothetical protein